MINRFKQKGIKTLFAVISILLFLVIWQLGVMFSTRLNGIIPTPVEVLTKFFVSFVEPIGKDRMLGHIAWSLIRVLPAYIGGSLLGIAAGITMGWYRPFEAILRPIYEVLRPIPPLAWIPIAIVWFGIGEGSKWFLITLASFMPITLSAYFGAKSVDPTLVKCSKMLGASDRQVFTSIVIPSSIPHIFAGLHSALAASWATVVAAEMIRSSEGVGWILISSMEINDITQGLAGMVGIGVTGFALATIMRGVEDKLCAWNKRGL